MRSDGRLTYAEFLPYDVRYPIILPRKNWVTKVIVKYNHELGNHSAGTNQTLSSLSTRFWIISAREKILEWERECAFCKRRKAKVAQQITTKQACCFITGICQDSRDHSWRCKEGEGHDRKERLTEEESQMRCCQTIERILWQLCELLCEDPNEGFKWIFNPPYAPHFECVFEIMIKSAESRPSQ